MSTNNWEGVKRVAREEWIKNMKGPDNFDTVKLKDNEIEDYEFNTGRRVLPRYYQKNIYWRGGRGKQDISSTRIYIDVPYKYRALAKCLNAEFDGQRKKWFYYKADDDGYDDSCGNYLVTIRRWFEDLPNDHGKKIRFFTGKSILRHLGIEGNVFRYFPSGDTKHYCQQCKHPMWAQHFGIEDADKLTILCEECAKHLLPADWKAKYEDLTKFEQEILKHHLVETYFPHLEVKSFVEIP